jgi:DNA-binding response OmpR family regulator/DNA-binding CsgD family transcriptional regulator
MNVSPKVLVIDDTPANLGVLLDALTHAQYEPLVAESGRSALHTLDHTTPDLILLDVVMPGIDGYETCRQIKARPECANIPVLFMTALSETDEKVRAFAAGAVDYITKPFNTSEVLARVATHLDLQQLRQNLEDELSMRIEAETLLQQSLDRAVVLIEAGGRIVFSTRLAEALLHKYYPPFDRTHLPPDFEHKHPDLEVRRFADGDQRDLQMFVLQEINAQPGPAALLSLNLTAREAEVLYWIAQGKSNPDIASIITTSVRTVHKHVENIFRKLGLETRNAASLVAMEVLRPAGR